MYTIFFIFFSIMVYHRIDKQVNSGGLVPGMQGSLGCFADTRQGQVTQELNEGLSEKTSNGRYPNRCSIYLTYYPGSICVRPCGTSGLVPSSFQRSPAFLGLWPLPAMLLLWPLPHHIYASASLLIPPGSSSNTPASLLIRTVITKLGLLRKFRILS